MARDCIGTIKDNFGKALVSIIWAVNLLPCLITAHIDIETPGPSDQECAIDSASDLPLRLSNLQQLSFQGSITVFLEQSVRWDMPSAKLSLIWHSRHCRFSYSSWPLLERSFTEGTFIINRLAQSNGANQSTARASIPLRCYAAQCVLRSGKIIGNLQSSTEQRRPGCQNDGSESANIYYHKIFSKFTVNTEVSSLPLHHVLFPYFLLSLSPQLYSNFFCFM